MSDEQEKTEFIKRLRKKIPRCTHQTWFPDEDSDNLIWSGNTDHGICVTDISPLNGHKEMIDALNKAIETCTAIKDISAIEVGLSPLFLTACRHYRLPIPPNFWLLHK